MVIELDWDGVGQWAGHMASFAAVGGAFLLSIKWMFDQLNKNNLILTQKVDGMHQELKNDMIEIRLDAKRAHERIDETNRRIDASLDRIDKNFMEATQRIDETNKRIDETNRRIDASLERIDKNFIESNKRTDAALERIDKNFIESNKRTDAALERIDKIYDILMQGFHDQRQGGHA